MIKLSDITVSVRKLPLEGLDSHTLVTAHWERSEESIVHCDYASDSTVIEREKRAVRHRLVARIYSDLIDPLAELEHIALMSPYVDPNRVRELVGRIHAIMEARG